MTSLHVMLRIEQGTILSYKRTTQQQLHHTSCCGHEAAHHDGVGQFGILPVPGL